jgi:lipid-A-disaccharide synthase
VKTPLHIPFVALPNILVIRRLVSELLQHAAKPQRLAAALIVELERGRAGVRWAHFRTLHFSLRRGAHKCAAAAALVLRDR